MSVDEKTTGRDTEIYGGSEDVTNCEQRVFSDTVATYNVDSLNILQADYVAIARKESLNREYSVPSNNYKYKDLFDSLHDT